MATVTGRIGSSGNSITFKTAQSINLQLGANDKPYGTITFTDIKAGGAYWRNNNYRNQQAIDLYLCDSAGGNKAFLFRLNIPGDSSRTEPKTATVDAPQLKGKALYLIAENASSQYDGRDYIVLRNATGITLDTSPVNYNITCQVSPANCGTLTASTNSTAPGNTVTLLPTPAAGYKFVKYTSSPNLAITNNQFVMPGQNVTVTAVFERIVYAVTCKASPSNGGTLTADRATAGPGDTVTLTPKPASGYYLTGYTSTPSVTVTNNQFTMPGQAITIQANFALITYGITCQVTPTGAGTLKTNKTAAAPGDTITLTPSPGTGWKLKKYTSSPSVTFAGDKFAMPGQAITVTAEFEKVSYTITGSSSPADGGSVTLSKNAANMGDEITFGQTPNTGYYFNGWTFTPPLTPSGNKFTMPANNVGVKANYLKRSTAELSSKSVTGAGTVTLNIAADKTTYSHKYKLSFGTGMETSLTNVAAGVKSVVIQIPENWSNQIPNNVSKTGGTLLLETYNGSTKIGDYTITGMTFNVPAGYVPSISDITTDIIRTIAGKTYANIGAIYTQNHSGVRIRATGAGNHDSTIVNMTVTVGGYTGGNYNKTFAAAAVDFTTGLLTIAGATVITVTATDSRGRTTSKTKTISVTEYNVPGGSLSAWRCDVNGDTDPMGIYGKYEITKRYSEIGTNSLTVTLESQGTTATISADTGDIMPGSRQIFSIQQEYRIKLTLQDAFETTEIRVTLQSARFILYVNADGTKLGLMKATTKSIPAGKNATIELSGDAQIYIGDETIEEFITRIAGS